MAERNTEFFDKLIGKYLSTTGYASGDSSTVSVEDLYQEFKARMIAELEVRSIELLNPAEIVERFRK